MSLYVIREIEKSLARPSRQELLQAIREQPDIARHRGSEAGRLAGLNVRVALVQGGTS